MFLGRVQIESQPTKKRPGGGLHSFQLGWGLKHWMPFFHYGHWHLRWTKGAGQYSIEGQTKTWGLIRLVLVLGGYHPSLSPKKGTANIYIYIYIYIYIGGGSIHIPRRAPEGNQDMGLGWVGFGWFGCLLTQTKKSPELSFAERESLGGIPFPCEPHYKKKKKLHVLKGVFFFVSPWFEWESISLLDICSMIPGQLVWLFEAHWPLAF